MGESGNGPLVLASPDPEEFRTYWTGLTVYRLGGQEFQRAFGKALVKAQKKYGVQSEPLRAVIQTTMDVIQSPTDYPFCLTHQEWIVNCKAKFGGQLDGSAYKPPSIAIETSNIVLKLLLGSAVAAVSAKLAPGPIGSGIGAVVLGTTAKDLTTKSIPGLIIDHFLPPGNPLDDYDKEAVFKRYEKENNRRKLP